MGVLSQVQGAGFPEQPSATRKGCKVKGSSLVSRHSSLVCPHCEGGELRPFGHHSARCGSCAGLVRDAVLEALQQIAALPDALGAHPCEECGHPEMRLLPDGTFHCPSCGSEVLPFGAPAVEWEISERTEAYRCGWIDGRLGEIGNFVDNPNLAKWGNPSERLDYYRGHRAGSEDRRASILSTKSPSEKPSS
jgi:ribosomal protein L37AE/L43A